MPNERYFGRACKTCRRRGRKCDRRLPACKTCEISGQTCEGYLIQWPGLASRGQFVGKSIPISETPKLRRTTRTKSTARTPAAPISQHSTPSPTKEDDQPVPAENFGFDSEDAFDPLQLFMGIEDVEILSDSLVCSNSINLPDNQSDDFVEDHTGDANQFQNPTPQVCYKESGHSLDFSHVLSVNPHISVIPDELKFIMQYHISEVVPKLCVDNLSPQNPYRDYVLPLAIEVPSLLYACAALAACHFNVRLSTNQFERDFFRFKGKAMKRLQEDLYSQTRAKHPGTVATILMLCLCDLCHGGVTDLQSHFEGAKRLIELREERTMGSFVEQYLAWLDVMAAASHSRPTVWSSQEVIDLLGESGNAWSFDAIPCPSDQFQIVCEIVDLYKSQLNPDHPSAETLIQVQEIKQRLLQRPAHCERGQNWLHMTEAYRFAIILYLLRLFSCDIDEFELDWLVSSVLYHARATPPASGWSDQLLWPLFHAGVELKDDKRQEWIRERARCMQSSGGFGNVKSALVLLEAVWKGQRPAKYIDLMLGYASGSVLLI